MNLPCVISLIESKKGTPWKGMLMAAIVLMTSMHEHKKVSTRTANGETVDWPGAI